MNKFSEMSDFEVNKQIAKYMLKSGAETWTFNNNLDKVQFFNETTNKCRVVDYCNNWADMGPLIASNNISIISDGVDGYYANNGYLHHSGSIFDDEVEAYNKNPLRAAAEVYLMIKDAEKC